MDGAVTEGVELANDHLPGSDRYVVNDLYRTIQGEGTLCGVPMLLIRLQYCPVGCPFCDTKETWKLDPEERVSGDPAAWRGRNRSWAQVDAKSLAALAREEAGAHVSWVLLTGGEPAEQPLGPLVRALHDVGFKVQLETSGTATGFIDGDGGAPFTKPDWVCVSPKIGMPGGRTLKAEALAHANEIKFVIGKESDVAKLRAFYDEWGTTIGESLTDGEATEHSLQPVSLSPSATALCMELCQTEGFRLSLQMHRYIMADGADRSGPNFK